MIDRSYFRKYDNVVNMYVPRYGEGDNKASQAASAVLKLIYKYYNDGDVYDNTYHLEGWWNDISSYANWLYQNLDWLLAPTLSKIEICRTQSDYEYLLKLLADLVLDNEELLERLSKLPKVGSIYSCDGPFKYEEKFEDDDDYYDEW